MFRTLALAAVAALMLTGTGLGPAPAFAQAMDAGMTFRPAVAAERSSVSAASTAP